jgi:hypothetical protein
VFLGGRTVLVVLAEFAPEAVGATRSACRDLVLAVRAQLAANRLGPSSDVHESAGNAQSANGLSSGDLPLAYRASGAVFLNDRGIDAWLAELASCAVDASRFAGVGLVLARDAPVTVVPTCNNVRKPASATVGADNLAGAPLPFADSTDGAGARLGLAVRVVYGVASLAMEGGRLLAAVFADGATVVAEAVLASGAMDTSKLALLVLVLALVALFAHVAATDVGRETTSVALVAVTVSELVLVLALGAVNAHSGLDGFGEGTLSAVHARSTG